MEKDQQFLHFEETGHLKAGIHPCSWEALQELTFTNFYRHSLGTKLLNFLKWPSQTGHFRWVYIGGGFVSDHPSPRDIDLILETHYPFGREAFAAVEPFFSEGLEKILTIHSIHLHFWMEGGPATLMDYRSFFQYHRPLKPRCLDAKRKGVLRLSLHPKDLLSGISTSYQMETRAGSKPRKAAINRRLRAFAGAL